MCDRHATHPRPHEPQQYNTQHKTQNTQQANKPTSQTHNTTQHNTTQHNTTSATLTVLGPLELRVEHVVRAEQVLVEGLLPVPALVDDFLCAVEGGCGVCEKGGQGQRVDEKWVMQDRVHTHKTPIERWY